MMRQLGIALFASVLLLALFGCKKTESNVQPQPAVQQQGNTGTSQPSTQASPAAQPSTATASPAAQPASGTGNSSASEQYLAQNRYLTQYMTKEELTQFRTSPNRAEVLKKLEPTLKDRQSKGVMPNQ